VGGRLEETENHRHAERASARTRAKQTLTPTVLGKPLKKKEIRSRERGYWRV